MPWFRSRNAWRKKKVAGGGTLGAFGASVGATFSTEGKATIERPATIIDAMDILSFVAETRRGHRTIVVIDEFDRISSDLDKVLFTAELIKNLPTRDINLRFILCGIGHTVDGLLRQAHLGRALLPADRA